MARTTGNLEPSKCNRLVNMFTAFNGLPPKISSLASAISANLKGAKNNLPAFKAFVKNLRSEKASNKNMKLYYALAINMHLAGIIVIFDSVRA